MRSVAAFKAPFEVDVCQTFDCQTQSGRSVPRPSRSASFQHLTADHGCNSNPASRVVRLECARDGAFLRSVSVAAYPGCVIASRARRSRARRARPGPRPRLVGFGFASKRHGRRVSHAPNSSICSPRYLRCCFPQQLNANCIQSRNHN